MHRGGGNSRLASHNHGFSLVEAFNNLALWGENKFVSELKRAYKFKRGVNNILDCHANQTRILSKEYSFVAGDYVRSTARNDVKCHAEDKSPKYRMVGKMKGNNFFDKVHSLFTTHHSLKRAGATHVALCESVGSYFRHWCGAFTLAEVLVTLGIIGVVSAMTVPTLMQNYQRQSYITQLHKVYNEVQQGALRYMTDRNAINLMEAGLTNSAAMQEFLRDNFKIVSMGTTDSDMPWNNVSYKNLNGGSWTSGTWGCGPCAVLASGAWVCADNPKCYTYSYGGHTSWYGMFFVDINGKKGPNIIGRDTFLMELWSDGVLDLPKVSPACRTLGVCDGDSIEAIRNTGTACEGSTTYTHQRCFANILNNNWEMNY